ncbi:MAG: putative transcriptional regulator, TetR family [Frankiales bacterium]|nr:putative transcriptional regulator, TetR family [Frankiales bacterium]
MSTIDPRVPSSDDSPAARDRLLRALEARVGEGRASELAEVTIEDLAEAAGVSRATAYRYFGNKSQLPRHAALILLGRFAAEATARASIAITAGGRIADSLAFWTGLINEVELLREPWAAPDSRSVQDRFRWTISASLTPIVRAGQADGQLRNSLPTLEVVSWLAEQGITLIDLGRPEVETRLWIKRFVLPAVRGQAVSSAAKPLLETCLHTVRQQLESLDELARRGRELSEQPR